MQMDRDSDVSMMTGLFCVLRLLSLHTSPASIMLPLLQHAWCGHSRRAESDTSAFPELVLAECSSSVAETFEAAALHGASALMTSLSLCLTHSASRSLSLILSLSFSCPFFLTGTEGFMTASASKEIIPTAERHGTSCSAHHQSV